MLNVALYYAGICCWCISLGQHTRQIVYLNSPMLLEMTRGATDYKIYGLDRVTVFESWVGSFLDQQQKR